MNDVQPANPADVLLGELLAEYALPAMCPTMCAFGGPDLRTLFRRQDVLNDPKDAFELRLFKIRAFASAISANFSSVAGLIEPKYFPLRGATNLPPMKS